MSILFHEIQIGDTFGWRGSTWTKTDHTHAVPIGADAEAASEHVPSHDVVLMMVDANLATPPLDDRGEPGGVSPRTTVVS